MSGTFIENPHAQWLPDKRRLQLRHGPIDLVIEAFGAPGEVRKSYENATYVFGTILHELVGELDLLRKPIGATSPALVSKISRRMLLTTTKIAQGRFATPMIAVAGAVADHVLKEMTNGCELSRAYVNNGGDIALHLSPGENFDVGVCANPLTGEIGSTVHLTREDGVFGIATSGWRGRSYSLGIADAVTVLAQDAGSADVAATLIANAINLQNHSLVEQCKASELSPDSDLADMKVTTKVGALSSSDIQSALLQGKEVAQLMIDRGDIISVFAKLQTGNFTISSEKALTVGTHLTPRKSNELRLTHA